MILSGAISTPTTSADMKPLIDIGARENQPEIPLRSIRGQFGPLNVKDMLESSSQLVRSNADEIPKEMSGNSTFVRSVLKQAVLWKNVVILWICTIIFTILNRKSSQNK